MLRVLSFICLASLSAGAAGASSPTSSLPASPARPEAAAAPAGLTRAEIRAATAALAVAGYGPGPIDGDWGERDAAALQAYQADWRLPETGDPTAELVARLTREHPATAPRWVETETGCRAWDRYPQAQETVTWTGACIDGLTAGTGRLTWTSVLKGETRVETYEGERRAGRENGEGTYIDAEGGRYSGHWRDGLKDGTGIYLSPEGHVYVGGYRDGLRHGRGTYIRAEGSRYEGEWRNGTEEGEGVVAWRDGSRYQGRLADGKPEGEGTLTFPDGSVYSGAWRAGCLAEATRAAAAGVTLEDCGWK